MVLGKKVAIFDWEWGGNSAPREKQLPPCLIASNTLDPDQAQNFLKLGVFIKELFDYRLVNF